MTFYSQDQSLDKSDWSLNTWLAYLESIHPKNIDMGLDRVNAVFHDLSADLTSATVITVAGTNGKGTTCAMLEQAGMFAGKKVAVYSSPHILDYRERVRVNGQMLEEAAHCHAFLQVEIARQTQSLTYFEFSTLAALYLISQQQCDWVILEVGLGGRLDAVNIVDPNLAVITSIDLDHQDWLGDTREAIAIEKAGIIRADIPVVIGEPDPPLTLLDSVNALTSNSYWQGRDFSFQATQNDWQWQTSQLSFAHLSLPHIPMQNASTALMVIALLDMHFSQSQLNEILSATQLTGRQQVIMDAPTVMLDVAHNPHATRLLAKTIRKMPHARLRLVVGMLADKDIAASLAPLCGLGASWYVASLDVPRGADKTRLKSVLNVTETVIDFNHVGEAFEWALNESQNDDLIVVFGSFFTVAKVMQKLNNNKKH